MNELKGTCVNKKYLLSFILVGTLMGCAQQPRDLTPSPERQPLDFFYAGTGVMTYFLPDLPIWARGVSSFQCGQNFSVKHINADHLRASFSYTYQQAINFQNDFNLRLKEMSRESSTDAFSTRDHERLFFDINDRIQSDITSFQMPRFTRVHLIPVDWYLLERLPMEKLDQLMNSEEMDLGHPVFISLCFEREELQELAQSRFAALPIRLLGYEVLSPYDKNGTLIYERHFDLGAYFHDKEIVLFRPRNHALPRELRGEFKTHLY